MRVNIAETIDKALEFLYRITRLLTCSNVLNI